MPKPSRPPVPWVTDGVTIYDSHGDAVAVITETADPADQTAEAEHITRCINTHAELIECLSWAIAHVPTFRPGGGNNIAMLERCRAALAATAPR